MRRVLFTMLLFVLTASVSKAQRPPIFWTEEKCFGVNAGYKHLSLNAGSFDVGYIELSCFINPTLGWEFTTNLEYGKDYLSFSPSGLLGLPFWIYATSHNSGREANMLGAILSVASARMPLKICDWLEFDPGWNLLKLTKLYKSGKFKLNGDIGLQIKIYPFCQSFTASTFFISGHCLYNFAYKKNASDYIFEAWGNNIKRTDKSLFFGFSYGGSIGFYF